MFWTFALLYNENTNPVEYTVSISVQSVQYFQTLVNRQISDISQP